MESLNYEPVNPDNTREIDRMTEPIKNDQWVWVVVQDPERNEQFLGQYDEKKDESFIPVFLEKITAQIGLDYLVREKGHKYEIQAILFEELVHHAAENGFNVYVLNGSGHIMEKIKL